MAKTAMLSTIKVIRSGCFKVKASKYNHLSKRVLRIVFSVSANHEAVWSIQGKPTSPLPETVGGLMLM